MLPLMTSAGQEAQVRPTSRNPVAISEVNVLRSVVRKKDFMAGPTGRHNKIVKSVNFRAHGVLATWGWKLKV